MRVPLVLVGTSLGGLDALTVVLGALPRDLPAAVIVVQHRRPDSDSRLADLLCGRCRLQVREAQDKDRIVPGTVFVAPADYHLLIDGDLLALTIDEPVTWARPSIDVLFESAAQSVRRRLIGVLLTAASDDGAEGIAAIARVGGVTIVQDPAQARSAVAPLAALSRTRVAHVLGLERIGPLVIELVKDAAAAREEARLR